FKIIGGRILLVVLFLAVWQLLSGTVIPAFFISSPAAVFVELAQLVDPAGGPFFEAPLWINLAATLWAALIGYLIGATIAIVAGFVLGQLETVSRILDPFIIALYSIPKV